MMEKFDVKVICEFCFICLLSLSITTSFILFTSKEWLITDEYKGICEITASFNACPEITVKGIFIDREENTTDFIRHLTFNYECYDIYLSLINKGEYIECYKYRDEVYLEIEFDRNSISMITIMINVLCIIYINVLCYIKKREYNDLNNRERFAIII